jgi:DNA-binding NtrC family response regulator
MMQKKILIVDDELIILKSLQMGLSHHGYEVDTAMSGGEALALLERHGYNLLITDLLMEGMSGMELLKKAKELKPDLAICLITGYADLASAIEALRLGADDYLVKPCELEELLFRVKHALEREDLRCKVRYFEKILPVCAVCKKIRDDTGKQPGEGEWISLEQFLHRKTGVQLKPGYCHKCARRIKGGAPAAAKKSDG